MLIDEVKKEENTLEKEDINILPTSMSLIKEKDHHLVGYGDVIIICESRESYKQVKVEVNGFTQNKYGHFLHSDFIGKPLGSKVNSISKIKKEKVAYITLLDFHPSTWERTCERLTQIIFSPDISIILTMMDIKKDSIIFESGTGSGSLSINIANCLSENGHLYTFEFNKQRVEKLNEQFNSLHLSDIITVINQDVYEEQFRVPLEKIRDKDLKRYNILKDKKSLVKKEIKEDFENKDDELLNGIVDAMFVDLPMPWFAVNAAVKKLKRNGVFIGFSPCIEQVEKTFNALKENNFIHPRMFECCYRSYNYIKTERIDLPDYDILTGEYEYRNSQNQDDKYNKSYEDALITSSSNDMKGHTGFLTFAVKQ